MGGVEGKVSMPELGTRSLLWGLSLIALAAGGLAPSVAQAQDDEGPIAMQRIYIVATAIDPELEPVAARAGAAARAALRQVDGADWQAADQRYLGYDDNTLEKLRIAREKLEEGRAAYLDLRLDEAVTVLQEAVDNFNLALSALEDPRDLGEALLFLGASQVFNGDNRGARDTFHQLHVQMPHIQPDPEIFPPDVVERYEQSAPRRMDASVSVESDPAGAVAYVDFIPRGQTPVSVEGLARGEHSVRVVAPGSTPYIENIELGRSTGEVAAFLMALEGNEGLPEAVQGLAGHELQQADGVVAEIANVLQLDKVGVIRASYGDSPGTVKLELVVFDVASQRRVLRGEVEAPREIGELEPVVSRAVQQAIENVLRPRVGEDDETIPAQTVITPEPDDDDDDGGDGIATKWWFWTAIGGVVVVGAVIAIAATQAGGGGSVGQDPGGQVVFEF
ncbi:MAG: hypothetical protein CMN31_07405 [Sandaracinus sp.]|nr:hypothetical protein [Myxococcales bacterium]MBJ71152.1 hypothetical protein [Sandaracinus sp.]